MRTIIIAPALNGFVVKVGCQTVVFDSHPKLIAALGAYLENPEKVEREFIEQAVNKVGPLAPQSAMPPRDYCDSAAQERMPVDSRPTDVALERNPKY